MSNGDAKAAFRWDDPLLLEEQLRPHERRVGDTARHYALDKLMPRILSANREERFDPEMPRRDWSANGGAAVRTAAT